MNICVRNLSPLTSRSELMACFEKFGLVTDVSISTYAIKGKLQALGVIVMPSLKQGQAAIDTLQSKELDGKLLNIKMEQKFI